MKSRWYDKKEQAIVLRQQGLSITEIEKLLLIPRSTLSGWLKVVKLTDAHKLRLKQNSDIALVKARVKASAWHRAQKQLRLKNAEEEAESVLKEIAINDNVVELAAAMLYLGEGAKNNTTAIGNSNPLILKFFIAVLKKKYGLGLEQIRCELHLRADQKSDEMKEYWSKELDLPLSSFRTVVFDQRTAGRPTYPDYKGVCIINCGNIAIQRKLIYLYNQFCQKVMDEWAVSSTG